jgi:hypothetical protein
VKVALSAVQTSAPGPWFGRMTVTWAGKRPPNSTPDALLLPRPVHPLGDILRPAAALGGQ